MRIYWLCLPLLALGCAPPQPDVARPQVGGDFTSALHVQKPSKREGECWHSEIQPALYETVTLQEIVSPEKRDASNAVIEPARFRSVTRQSELRPRRETWFRIPCPEDRGREEVFIASLQRALKARGVFGTAVTGEMDRDTRAAVARFQALHGLHSSELSYIAAQRLGLITVVEELR